jgi:hypothetical protein
MGIRREERRKERVERGEKERRERRDEKEEQWQILTSMQMPKKCSGSFQTL